MRFFEGVKWASLISAAIWFVALYVGCAHAQIGGGSAFGEKTSRRFESRPGNPKAHEFRRFTQYDIESGYLGAFRVQNSTNVTDGAGSAIVRDPATGDLLIGSAVQQVVRVPFFIDTLTVSETTSGIPQIQWTGHFDPTDGLINQGNNDRIGSMVPWETTGWFFTVYDSYNVAGVNNNPFGFVNKTFGEGDGLYHAGPVEEPYHSVKMEEYITLCDPNWIGKYVDQPTDRDSWVMVGRMRPNGAFGGSKGPALFLVNPDSTVGGNLYAAEVMHWTPPDSVNALYSPCDRMEGVFIYQKDTDRDGVSKAAVLFSGVLGTDYPDNYGEANCECGSSCTEDCITVIDPCGGPKAFHCWPYRNEMWLYDVDDLGQALRGQIAPQDPVPYAMWEPTEAFPPPGGTLLTCGRPISSMYFEADTGLLFGVQPKVHGNSSSYGGMVVHVWDLSE